MTYMQLTTVTVGVSSRGLLHPTLVLQRATLQNAVTINDDSYFIDRVTEWFEFLLCCGGRSLTPLLSKPYGV